MHLPVNANRATQIAWLAFAGLATGLAIPGIPHYVDLLRTPCTGPDCLDMRLTFEATRAWSAQGQSPESYALIQLLIVAIIDVLLVTTSAFLIWRKAANPAAALAAFVGMALASSPLSQALANSDPRLWFPAQVVLFVQMAGLLPLFLLFPDGNFQPRALRWVALLYVLASFIYLTPDYRQRLAPGTLGGAVSLPLALLALLIVVATLFSRFRRATTSLQQEQMLWLLAGIGLAAPVVLLGTPLRMMNLALIPITVLDPGLLQVLDLLLAAGSFTCILVALLNYEPLDAAVLVNRTLVYATLTACVIAVYGLVVGYLSTVFHSDSVLFSLIASGLVAVLFQPFHERLQRAVNRLMYGERNDPYRVLTLLGEQMETTIERAAALPLAVETVARALKLPYVAIMLELDGRFQPVAAYGSAQGNVTHFPLIYAGETIGELVIASRAPAEPLSAADRQLLSHLAQQISVTAHAAQLANELQRARLRIVAAREESRRQLGADLHDGVGHQLTGLARQAELVAYLLERDPATVPRLVAEIAQNLNTTIGLVRALAHQLHPPELELLGLAGALRERAETHTGLVIRLDVPASLPALPAAVETAAYYIALEALTNIEKHASARSCAIRVALASGDTALAAPVLEMEITDDGRGLPANPEGGLGLLSMQARALEVGGTCQVEASPKGGTRVGIRLPYHPAGKEG